MAQHGTGGAELREILVWKIESYAILYQNDIRLHDIDLLDWLRSDSSSDLTKTPYQHINTFWRGSRINAVTTCELSSEPHLAASATTKYTQKKNHTNLYKQLTGYWHDFWSCQHRGGVARPIGLWVKLSSYPWSTLPQLPEQNASSASLPKPSW